MSATAAAVALLVPTVVLAYLDLYFLLLSRVGWAAAARRWGVLARRCGADTDPCALVARTAWARVVFGVPNTVFGLAWVGVLAWLALGWLRWGVIWVPWWALAGAVVTIASAVLLVWALVVRVRQRCPL